MIIKTKYILKVLFTILITLNIASCGYNEDVIEELSIDREFAPVALTARVRNQTIVELDWTVRDDVEQYVVEFSADDPNFTTIFKTENVTASQLPIQIPLEGLTEYSIRVKAISANGISDSSWANATATTLGEQLLFPYENGDITHNTATFKWPGNINVTQLVFQPGDITHNITAQEKTDGIAIVTGLNSVTEYNVELLNNDKIRGYLGFKTEVDPATGTIIDSTNDLLQMIANAASGTTLLLEPGDYTSQTGTATLNKSITIRGLFSYNIPLLNINFEIEDGSTDVSLINLDLDGAAAISDVVTFSEAGNYNSLLISGCNIHDFNRTFVRGPTTDAILQSLIIENCIVTNVLTSGGDLIDFRNSDVFNLSVISSTFNNSAPGRDFIRIDDSGTSSGGTGSTCNVLIESCTLYMVSNSSSKRIVYVRFNVNEIEIRNTLITDSPDIDAISDRDQTDEDIVFVNNNYFNAPALTDSTEKRYDPSATTLDPGFVNPMNGDFTVTNQTILDNAIGDPRWR